MKSMAQRLADHRREQASWEHERCEQVIVEFGGGREDMAAEILRLRYGLAKVAEVISWCAVASRLLSSRPGHWSRAMGTYQEAVEQAYKQRQMADIQRASKLGMRTAEYQSAHKAAINSWAEIIRELMAQNAAHDPVEILPEL